MRRYMLGALVLGGILILPAREAGAIPAWSRRHDIACNMCHIRFNRLNQHGLDYYRKGLRDVVKPATMQEDEDNRLKTFGNYVGLLGTADLTMRTDRDYTGSVKATVYAGGPFSNNFSFLLETTVNPPSDQEVADLSLQWTAGTNDRYVFLRGGQLLPLLTIDNPWEIAADRDAVFPRDRRWAGTVGYNVGKLWGELGVMTPSRVDDAPTRNKADFVLNGQYTLSAKGSSLGGLYWNGNINVTDSASNSYRRWSVVGNYNEIDKLYLTAGYAGGTGNFGEAGEPNVGGAFAQAEYLLTDKLSALVHLTRTDPDVNKDGDTRNIWTVSTFFWPQQNVNLVLNLVSKDLPRADKRDNQFRVRLRFMF